MRAPVQNFVNMLITSIKITTQEYATKRHCVCVRVSISIVYCFCGYLYVCVHSAT